MKVLIVDDEKTNRTIIRKFLNEYKSSDKRVSFELDEARDGVEAVEKSKLNQYNLIFMDVNMPNMNGIEASRIIRSHDDVVMIIAVSVEEDMKKQRNILNNGAEDYISKPIDFDIFAFRLKSYISLIESREHYISSPHIVNLYTDKVYCRHTIFILNSEDSLAEFWEFFLLNARKKSQHLSDVIRVIFSIVEKQMQFSDKNKLYIEESETEQYFTLTNIDVLPKKVINLLILKNGIKDCFKINSNKISFELIKAKQYEDELIVENPIEKIKETQTVKKIIEHNDGYEISKKLTIFDYMDADDLLDLEEYADSLNSLMLLVGGGSLEYNDIIEMSRFLDKVGAILSSYSDIYVISNSIYELSHELSTHMEEFTKNAEYIGPMCAAFSKDLSHWIQQSFYTGAPSVDFMNDTIKVNCQTIIGMLKVDEVAPADGEDDFDDIFDF